MKVATLGDVFQIGSSKRVLKSQWQTSGIPFYRGREITRLSTSGNANNELYISSDLYAEFKDKYGVPRAGDIMMTAIGTIGNTYIVKDNEEFYFKDASVLWLKKRTEVVSRYIDLWFRSPYFISQLDQGNGTTVDTLTIKKLQSICIALPSTQEQEQLAVKLDTAFEKIEQGIKLTKRNIENVRFLYESKFHSLMSDTAGTEVALSDVCEINSKLVDPKEKPYQNQIHIGAANIQTGNGELLNLKTAQDEKLISGKFPFNESTILYSKIRPYLMKVARPNFSGICSADVYPLSPKDNLDKDYLFYLLLSPDFTQYAIDGSQRAGMPKVNRDHLFAYNFNLPDLAHQQDIVQKLDKLLSLKNMAIDKYDERLNNLLLLKDSLLNESFSESNVK